ncbi:DNA-binding protein [Geomicrobium sp. JCM 19037]|uniref:HU family DNA-binding protein n=1 Tax=unclassified Geomicrobium TaxID=2628951 RepID=UPI00045F32DA|nr:MULTISPECIES: HU family DNA-binding protein [unclassified Geomicrobium]GAK02804.1 DNA-binding protein [Geomicrobium sp. JCM 19037]GAK10660.1 DNA-binding protein [Geomicrobium sp. JCM 19039]
MNKSELISVVADKSDLTKKQAEVAVNATFEAITEHLQSGDRVQLIGFGQFETRKREARTVRNPRTGEEIQVSASLSPAFKPGKRLKQAVNV